MYIICLHNFSTHFLTCCVKSRETGIYATPRDSSVSLLAPRNGDVDFCTENRSYRFSIAFETECSRFVTRNSTLITMFFEVLGQCYESFNDQTFYRIIIEAMWILTVSLTVSVQR